MTEFANTEPRLLGELLAALLPTGHPVTLFYVCFYWKTHHLTYTVDSLTLNLCLNEAGLTDFLCKAHCGLLVLKTTRQHFSAMLGGPFAKSPTKSSPPPKKRAKRVAPNTLQKGHVFAVWTEARMQGTACSTSAGNVRLSDSHFSPQVSLHVTVKTPHKYWLEGYKYILASRWICKDRILHPYNAIAFI